MRLLVTGGVNTGKSLLVPALAARLNAPYRYTDEALAAGGDWHTTTLCVANWLLAPGPWIIAGVRVPWALLHLLQQENYAIPPIIYLTRALSLETIAQAKMTKSVDAGWQQLQAIVRIHPLYKGPYHLQLCDNICKELQP